MKIGIGVLALVFLSAVGALVAQDHAILPEQCRADVRFWYSQSKSQNNSLSFGDLQDRAREMWACRTIDTGTGETVAEFKSDIDKYNLLYLGYVAFSGQRMHDYIQRQGETQQFLDEDAAGQR